MLHQQKLQKEDKQTPRVLGRNTRDWNSPFQSDSFPCYAMKFLQSLIGILFFFFYYFFNFTYKLFSQSQFLLLFTFCSSITLCSACWVTESGFWTPILLCSHGRIRQEKLCKQRFRVQHCFGLSHCTKKVSLHFLLYQKMGLF